MATSQTKLVTKTPWYTGSTVLLLLISLGTIAYTLTVTRQLADSLENLKKDMADDGEKLHEMFNKRIIDLERKCAQGRTNILHANQNVKIQSKIHSICYVTYIGPNAQGTRRPSGLNTWNAHLNEYLNA